MVQYNGSGNVYSRKSNGLYMTLGWVSAALSLFRLPFIFGVFGVIMGILATRDGSKAGLALIIGSMALMAIGLLFNGVLYNNLRHFIGF